MISILTEYPVWFIVFCISLGLLYAWFFYRKDRKLEEAPVYIKRIMFTLRFITVSIISFLLLSPILRTLSKTIEEPVIIFAQDNSESLSSEKSVSKKTYNNFKVMLSETKKVREFKTYTFGEEPYQKDSFSFTEKQTDISKIISEIKNRYYHRNIGALIIASDGIYNKGNNPEYEAQDLTFPIYTIALGDTAIKKDLFITDIKYNSVAFLNNKFPVQITVKANKLSGKKTKLKISDDDKILLSKDIFINKDNFRQKINLDIKAEKKGFRKLKIELDQTDNEKNIINNIKLFIIEVVDSKQKILILADSPHPDISSIRQSLELNQNFETEFYLANKFNKNIEQYNMIILHQIPSVNNSSTAVLSKIINSNIPVLYFLGSQSSLQRFDNLNTGLTTGAYSNAGDEVHGKMNTEFNLFEINEELEEITLNAPPVLSAFGDYKYPVNSQILFFRKVRNIDTRQPLMIFMTSGAGKKTAVFTGEGIWRWRIYDYLSNKNHYLFNELINNSIQYLTSRELKEQFNVSHERIVPENQKLIFKAELFDNQNNKTIKPDIRITVRDSSDKSDNYVFNRKEQSYFLDLGKFKSGDYKWNAETVIDGKRHRKSGLFSVLPNTSELENLKANHNILYKISKKTNGNMYYPENIDQLVNEIDNNDNIVSLAFSEKKTESLINFKIVFFFILLLLSIEWFMRKFHGTY